MIGLDLYDSKSRKGVTFTTFHSDGTNSLLVAILKFFVKEFAITGEAKRIILAGNLSIPVDLQGFKNKISLYTLDSDTAWNLKLL
jgi:hypothetical protein